MAETTAIDKKGLNGDSQYHQPRARKPNYIELLKPQLQDELQKQNGSLKDSVSVVSRLVTSSWFTLPKNMSILTSSVADRHLFLPMRRPPYKLLPQRDVRSGPSRSSAYFPQSSMSTVSRTSTRQAIIATSVASSSFSGSVSLLWS